jgi:hypothetical protein
VSSADPERKDDAWVPEHIMPRSGTPAYVRPDVLGSPLADREYICTIVVRVLADGPEHAIAKLGKAVPVSFRLAAISEAAQQPGRAAAGE